MNNIVTVNKELYNMAMEYEQGIAPTQESINNLINSSFEDNLTIDSHILVYRTIQKYKLKVNEYGYIVSDYGEEKPYKYVMRVLSDFRKHLNERIM
jgi:transcription termination factor NusB